MTPDDAFHRAIGEEPDDDTHRLVYADWLDEHGDPARAEFIRAQVERARLADDDPRAKELRARERRLLREHWEAWVGPLRELAGPDASRHGAPWLVRGYRSPALEHFHRGFVDTLWLDAATVAARADELFRLVPLRELTLWGAGRPGVAEALAGLPQLGTIISLAFADYWSSPLTSAGAAALAASPHLGRLRALSLYRNDVGDAGASALARARWLGGLWSLLLGDNGLSSEGVRALAAAAPPGLRYLQLDGNRPGEDGARALAAGFAGLATLSLMECALAPAAAEVLAAAPGIQWQNLTLSGNPLGPDGVAVLLRASWLTWLSRLYLPRCGVGDAGAAALAGCPALAELRVLNLRDNGITAAGAAALAASPHLSRTLRLDLAGNPCHLA
jgi:uncharacterized protein (TIGR02996 family)